VVEKTGVLLDISGKKFNRLTVIDFSHKDKGVIFWNCVCECGTKVKVRSQDIRKGHTKSCGCIQKSKTLREALERKLSWNGECLEWTGALTGSGYGFFDFKRKQYLAHRASYTVYKGKIPKGKMIRHMCHNPKCCNPKHLKTGTHLDNMQDAVKAGRNVRGENIYTAKLSENDVLEIRKNYKNVKHDLHKASEIYGVLPVTIQKVILRKTWTHI
jgi:hypothetical protein